MAPGSTAPCTSRSGRPGPSLPGLVVALGASVLAGVVAWRLARPSYPQDVEAICEAEARSGRAMRTDMAAVSEWVRSNLATPEGNELFSSLADLPVEDRAELLRVRAAAASVGPCPMVDAYVALVREGEYRADLQRLCSSVTFADLPELGNAARMETLERWIATEARSPRAADLGRALREAGTPEEQARALRDAAGDAGVLTCDVARTVELSDQ